jgi:purine-binding chemotaxis protein CheW
MANLDTTKEDVQFVTLGIENEVYAVPVATVVEILDTRPVFRIPETPAYLAGLIDVRGRGVPVIDLRIKLGLSATTMTENTRILVLEVPVAGRQIVLGLIADRVFEVMPLDLRQLEAPPDIGVAWRSDYIRGVGRRGKGFVIVFDLAKLFSTDEAAIIGRSTISAALAVAPDPAPETPSPALEPVSAASEPEAVPAESGSPQDPAPIAAPAESKRVRRRGTARRPEESAPDPV